MCIRDTINRIYALRNFPHSTTKCVRTICNNITFKNQKPYFCNAKTPFLHAKNHTFVLRTRNVHRMNTLRTLRKISTFNYEIPNEHSRKHPTYIPPGVGADSSCPYPYIAKYVFSHYQIHIFISPHTHFCSPFCGCIRI